ncbi:cytochrome b [Devosia alba]|uniref:cytochrome b n=1 Tax=Devosia alba TaxID=3152360 RepID=UPI003266FD9C
MSLTSTQTRYGSVAIAIHWLTALAILAMLISGMNAANTTDPATEVTLLRAHAVMGVLIGVLTILRIFWFVLFDQRPPAVTGMSRFQAIASRGVHGALYLVVLVMVASGIATLLLTGANLQVFGTVPLPLPEFGAVAPFRVHDVLSKVLIALLIGHIGAALYHQFIVRDRVMARMGLGR